MNSQEAFIVKRLNRKETLAYRMLQTEALFEPDVNYPVAYSILIVLAENGTVVQSDILFDVSRNKNICLNVMERLVDGNIGPTDAKMAVEAFL